MIDPDFIWWRARLSSRDPWVYFQVSTGQGTDRPADTARRVLRRAKLCGASNLERLYTTPPRLVLCGRAGETPFYYEAKL